MEVKDYNVMNDGRYLLDQPIKNDLKIAMGQGHDSQLDVF